MNEQTIELDIKNISEIVSRVETEVSKHMVGQKKLIRDVVLCILGGGNALLEGVPGLGKTTLVNTLGKVMGLEFSRIQFTPDLMPADVVGTNIISEGKFTFQKGPVFSNIVLADEINRATPKTQSAMLQAMQERTVTVGTNTYKLPEPFFVLATQNPIEMEGTYPLPEAQLDRFMYKLEVPFPSVNELMQIMTVTTKSDLEELTPVTSSEEILKARETVKQIPVAKPVMEFATRLVLATHPESECATEITKKYIRFGSSPRGGQAIISTARVRAVLQGRYNVSYEDIREVAYSALRHRIFMNFEATSAGITPDEILAQIIKEQEN